MPEKKILCFSVPLVTALPLLQQLPPRAEAKADCIAEMSLELEEKEGKKLEPVKGGGSEERESGEKTPTPPANSFIFSCSLSTEGEKDKPKLCSPIIKLADAFLFASFSPGLCRLALSRQPRDGGSLAALARRVRGQGEGCIRGVDEGDAAGDDDGVE